MKRLSFFAFCLLVAAGCSGGYDKHEKVAKELIAALDDISSACEVVTDQASARAAAGKIEQAADRLEKVADEMKDLPKITKSEDERLEKEYAPKIMAAARRMQSAAGRLAPYSADPAVQKAAFKLVGVGGKLQSIHP